MYVCMYLHTDRHTCVYSFRVIYNDLYIYIYIFVLYIYICYYDVALWRSPHMYCVICTHIHIYIHIYIDTRTCAHVELV